MKIDQSQTELKEREELVRDDLMQILQRVERWG